MRVKLWGVRGSIPVPGPAAAGYGGNTSCVGVTTDDGTELILDAGTGIRELGAAISGRCRHVHVLLTHLHLDHIQGLMFFAPLFDPAVHLTVWGPPAAGRALRERTARYISSPLSPVEIRELPARVQFRDAPTSPWSIGGVEVNASLVAHRGPTLGLPPHGGLRRPLLPPRPRTGARPGHRQVRAGLDLGARSRLGRLTADPRLPVRRRRIPSAPRLGPFQPLRRAHLRSARRCRQDRALPP